MNESANAHSGAIAAVLFDLDGVVRSADREVLAREEAKLGINPEVVKSALAAEPALWEAATTGRISDSEFRQSVRALVAAAYGEAVADARARIHRDAQRLNRELMTLVEQLRTRCLVGLVSNATAFVDDSQTNVDGATAAGMRSFLFTDTPTLARDLDGLV